MPADGASGRSAADRLARMLVVVPYLVQHPGTELAEAAKLFDADEKELHDDLMLLFMAGLPPYLPGDLIEVDIEDGRVWISMADQFSRPLRLSRAEALAVDLRGTELLATAGLEEAQALRSALDKLEAALGAEAPGGIETASGGRPAELLHELRAAAADRASLRVEYFSRSSGEWSSREIDPEEVFSSLGNWYVAAWDRGADAERLFRADRMRSAERTGNTFSPRGLAGAGRPLYTPNVDDVDVRVRLQPAARWIAEYYETTGAEEQGDGSLVVTLPAKRLGWVAGLMLRAGEDAEVLEPPELREQVARLARETLARYRG